MFKTMTFIALAPGVSSEEFFKYHTKVHALDAKKAAAGRMKKYVVNRVVEVMGGVGAPPQLYGIVEMWFENRADCDFYQQVLPKVISASGTDPGKEFEAHGGKFMFKLQVEEKDIPF